MATAYNPADPTQQAFLAALASGETGNPYQTQSTTYEGYGGVDTLEASGGTTDQYGFPQWGGVATNSGMTHAAGTYQFEPGTWDAVASQYGLDFSKPQDQSAGAWYTAQQQYAAKTNGGSLEDALSSGNISSVTSALSSTWPSLASGNFSTLFSGFLGDAQSSSGGMGGMFSGITGAIGGAQKTVSGWITRGFLIAIGVVVIAVALWALLSKTGAVPGPAETAKAVGKAAVL